jgi:hypothetical protein
MNKFPIIKLKKKNPKKMKTPNKKKDKIRA